MYKIVHPIEKDSTEISVPYHLPNIKPDISNIGVAKPKSKIHTIENMKNINTKIIA